MANRHPAYIRHQQHQWLDGQSGRGVLLGQLAEDASLPGEVVIQDGRSPPVAKIAAIK